MRFLGCVLALGLLAVPARADNKKLLLVTDSGGFIHDSVGLAEKILKEIGPKAGIDVTCFRYTRDTKSPDFAKYAENFRKTTGVPVEPENCGRVNAETLKKFDGVLFFTTGNPLANDEVAALSEWVKAGGAIAGTHCGSDTLYPHKDRPSNELYGDLIGAYFKTHPGGFQKIKIRVEDPKHPAAAEFKDDEPFEDEMYIFKDAPYSREKLHIILSITKDTHGSLLARGGKDAPRSDADYAISWCQEIGKGRSFYTSFGHRKEVWSNPKYQAHLIGGLKYALKLAEGDATPSAKLKKE